MNIFIHHRDLRFKDNTTLINQIGNEDNITPIFIFDPNQIDEKINKYFSHNLVQFMIESLKDLNSRYKNKKGELYTFKGEYIQILNYINKKIKINSVGFNLDYSPYAKKRDKEIIEFCEKNNIKVYALEDMLLHNLMDDQTFSGSNEPYKKFTPFKKNLINKNYIKS